jgi:hypothetical protein
MSEPRSPRSDRRRRLGGWSLFVAVVVVSIGLYIYLSAPKGSLLWLMAAIGVALVGQKVGGLFLSATHSGAVGAFLVVPFAMLAAIFSIALGTLIGYSVFATIKARRGAAF